MDTSLVLFALSLLSITVTTNGYWNSVTHDILGHTVCSRADSLNLELLNLRDTFKDLVEYK